MLRGAASRCEWLFPEGDVVSFISHFEKLAARPARWRKAEAVICGPTYAANSLNDGSISPKRARSNSS